MIIIRKGTNKCLLLQLWVNGWADWIKQQV